MNADIAGQRPTPPVQPKVHSRGWQRNAKITPLEADVSHKYFAPNVGLIKDDEFELAEKP